MSSQTEIANMALRALGQARVVDLAQDSNEAELIRDVWDNCRKASLRAFHWPFAKMRAELTASSAAPVFGWRFAWPLPSNYLRLIACNGIFSGTKLTCFDIEGGFLVSNQNKAKIEYTGDVPNCAEWDEQYVEAFSFYLASKIAPSLLKDGGSSAALMMQNRFNTALQAMSSSMIESKPEVITALQGSAYQAARCAPAPGQWDGCPGIWGLPAMYDVGFNPYNVPPP